MTRDRVSEGNEAGLHVGFDVGSSFVHYAVLGADRSVVYSPAALMHFANPLGALREAWEEVCRRFGREAIRSTALTGSAAESFPRSGDIGSQTAPMPGWVSHLSLQSALFCDGPLPAFDKGTRSVPQPGARAYELPGGRFFPVRQP